VCNIKENAGIPSSWILDNQSTVEKFANKKLMKNVQDANYPDPAP